MLLIAVVLLALATLVLGYDTCFLDAATRDAIMTNAKVQLTDLGYDYSEGYLSFKNVSECM